MIRTLKTLEGKSETFRKFQVYIWIHLKKKLERKQHFRFTSASLNPKDGALKIRLNKKCHICQWL